MSTEATVFWISLSVMVFFLLIILLVLVYAKLHNKRMKKNMPSPLIIPLPFFKGRILNSYMVKPGTFTIEVDSRDVSSWGEDAILTFGIEGGTYNTPHIRELMVKFWRPDDRTPGVFQVAKQVTWLPESWYKNGYHFDRAELRSKDRIVCPRFDKTAKLENANIVVHPHFNENRGFDLGVLSGFGAVASICLAIIFGSVWLYRLF
jgi:hypothetical protein